MKQKLRIVKIGGNVIGDEMKLSEFLDAFAKMEGLKVLVHGGGTEATRLADKLGIEVKMMEGRRITDDNMIDVVTMVYGGGVNKRIVAMLQSKSCNALGLTGADANLIRSIKRPLRNGIDYGWVGDPVSVNEKLLISLLSVSCVPVIAPLTHDGNGHILNTNADTISRFIAGSLVDEYQVELIYAFELNGVLETIDKSDSVIPKIDKSNYEKLKTKGVISDGMIPKLDNAFAAIESGVGRVSIMRYDKIDQINQSEHVCTVIV